MSINAVPDPPPDRTSTEPAMKVGGVASVIVTAVMAIIGALATFGVAVSPAQSSALVAAIVAVAIAAPIVSAWFTRSRVYAPATVATMLDDAKADATAAAHAAGPGATRWPTNETGR
jgi:hypothetical protein